MKFYFALIAVVATCISAVNYLLPAGEQWNYKSVHSPAKEVYHSDTMKVNFHLNRVFWHYAQPELEETLTSLRYRKDENLLKYYEVNSNSPDPVFSDIGNSGLAAIYFQEGFYDMAMEKLVSVSDKNQSGINLLKGMILEKADLAEKAAEAYKEELNYTDNKSIAAEKLGLVYLSLENYDAANAVVNKYHTTLNRENLAVLYLNNGNYFDYLQIRLKPVADLISTIASVLILLIWSLYLLKLNVFKTNNLKLYAVALIISLLCAPLAPVAFDIFNYFLHFRLNGEITNDFIYSIICIGLVEESVKILPLVILYFFSPSSFREPFDFLLIASLSALGFAFSENLLYLSDHQIGLIQGRALTATVSHMFDSSLIAYGIVLARYREPRELISTFLKFLLLAAIAHGFYDFWVLNETASELQFITPIFMVICLIFWVRMINNTLNISPFFNYRKSAGLSNLRKYLTASTVCIILFEYSLKAFFSGTEAANLDLSVSILSIGFFIFFYAGNFSSIDLVKGHWSGIKLSALYGKPDYNTLLYKKARIQLTDWEKHSLPQSITGTIEDRCVVGNDSDFFRIRVDTLISFAGKDYSVVLLQISGMDLDLHKTDNARLFFQAGKESALSEIVDENKLTDVGNCILTIVG